MENKSIRKVSVDAKKYLKSFISFQDESCMDETIEFLGLEDDFEKQGEFKANVYLSRKRLIKELKAKPELMTNPYSIHSEFIKELIEFMCYGDFMEDKLQLNIEVLENQVFKNGIAKI